MPDSHLPLLTLQEAMELFGISRATIDRWRRHKQLPFIKIGKEVFIDRRALESWLHRYASAPAAQPAMPGSGRRTLRVTVGYQSGTAHMWSALIIKHAGLFEEELRRLFPVCWPDITWHNAANGLELVEGLIAGTVHIASLGDYPIAISQALSRLLPSFQAVLLAFDGKTSNGKGISVLAPHASPVQSPHDLAHVTISTVANSSAGCRLQQLLRSMGGTGARVVYREMGESVNGLRERSIGASVMWEPYVSLLRDSGAAKVLFEEGIGGDYLTGIVADDRWVRANEGVAVAYLTAHLRAHDLIRSEPDKAASLIHLATGFPHAVARRVLTGVRWDAAMYERDLLTLQQLDLEPAGESLAGAGRTGGEGGTAGEGRSIAVRTDCLHDAAQRLGMPPLPEGGSQQDWLAEVLY